MTTLVNPHLWAARMRDAGVPREVIDSICREYELVPLELVTALMKDDRLCGIGGVTFGSSPDCAVHDALMICAKHGYSIATAESVAGRLVLESTEVGLRGLRDFALWPFKVLIGAPVGYLMDRWRASKR